MQLTPKLHDLPLQDLVDEVDELLLRTIGGKAVRVRTLEEVLLVGRIDLRREVG
jgi:hypothetical protein